MSAVVEVWVNEMGKLKEKVEAKKRFLWLSTKEKHAEGGDEGKVDQQQKPAVAAAAHEGGVMETDVRKERRNSSTLSEATVCLLMDRFVPW